MEKDTEALKRLEFYMDRFMEHKKSLDHAKEEVNSLRIKLDPELSSNPNIWRLNSELNPGCLQFYKEALEFSAKCRSFIVYTYPISHKIYDKNMSALFAENQYHLEYVLENFDELLIQNPVESLVTLTQANPCLSKNFPKVKVQVMNLKGRMTEQFENALVEFMDPGFLEKLEVDKQLWNQKGGMEMEESKSKKKKKTKKKKGKDSDDWYCTFCTYYNMNRQQNTCSICRKKGRPAPATS